MGFITPLLQLLAGLVGWGKDRSALKNAPDMKKAAVAKDELAARDKTRKAIREGDIEELRRKMAE